MAWLNILAQKSRLFEAQKSGQSKKKMSRRSRSSSPSPPKTRARSRSPVQKAVIDLTEEPEVTAAQVTTTHQCSSQQFHARFESKYCYGGQFAFHVEPGVNTSSGYMGAFRFAAFDDENARVHEQRVYLNARGVQLDVSNIMCSKHGLEMLTLDEDEQCTLKWGPNVFSCEDHVQGGRLDLHKADWTFGTKPAFKAEREIFTNFRVSRIKRPQL